MMAGCYTLDLYCDNHNIVEVSEFDTADTNHAYGEGGCWQYTGETLAECARQARRDGWLISKKRQLCPKCSGKL